ncbi:MAG TPA: BMP family ABC transporter substrate-binding protein [Aggregatilineaceae bacterium]|nr:BMP family ABC transporter substrate-binding protein [Aggregatilineaceae bacterium]
MNFKRFSLFSLLVVVILVLTSLTGNMSRTAAQGATPAATEAATMAATQAAPVLPKLTSLTVGILHVGAITDAGYNEAHADGIAAMKKNLPNVKVIEVENVPETADSERVMENMIQQGAKLIIPASFGYMDSALNVAARHPDVVFEFPSGYILKPNFGVYWGDTPEAFYLMGQAAGKMTKSNKLGFVVAFPISFILGNVNGFALGARSVNPNVVTHMVVSGDWADPAKMTIATNALIDEGADVVTMVQDSPLAVVQTAEKRGAYSIGFHFIGLSKFAPKGWISGIAFTWGPLYTRFAQQVMDGTWTSQSLLGGLDSDYMQLAPFGPAVPKEVVDMVNTNKQAIIDGKLNIWAGPIKDNTGTIRVKQGDVLTNDQLNSMDWLVDGAIGNTK